jgi:4-oxalomesaconate tautomerase
MQTRIPAVVMRGGTSKGLYFLATDLPADVATRDRVLLAAMGSPDGRQIDGMGGADPLTSKVAIVSPSAVDGVDVDYLFAQVVIDDARVDTAPNCGNMLAGVGAFAIEQGVVPARDGETTIRIHMVNSGNLCDQTVQTPGGRVSYDGAARIDGAPGTAAPVMINFLDLAGSACGSLLPTGNLVDEVDGIRVTCIDNGMPVVLMAAADLGATGYETRDELNADTALKARIEAIRLKIGPRMNLGDVTDKVVPKMCLVAPPVAGGAIHTRCFIPHVCHASIGVLAAVTVATACAIPGTVTDGIAEAGDGDLVAVEHPMGEFTVELAVEGPPDALVLKRAALLRTTRRLFEGNVLIPASIWDGRQKIPQAAE